MTQPISGQTSGLLGDTPLPLLPAGEQRLDPQHYAVLERAIARLIAMTRQQQTEVWANMRGELGIKNDAPLQVRHFPAAEQYLNQQVTLAEQGPDMKSVFSQMAQWLSQDDNRQAISDFIRQQYAQTSLSQLTLSQLKNVLQWLEDGQPPIFRLPPSGEPLLPAEYNRLAQLVSQLSEATGESGKLIWQSLIELVDDKNREPFSTFVSDSHRPFSQTPSPVFFSPDSIGERLPARYFPALETLLQAHLTLRAHPSPTLGVIQKTLGQSQEGPEWRALCDDGRQSGNISPQTVLSPIQVQVLLYRLFRRRIEHEPVASVPEARHIQPVYAPFVPLLRSLTSPSARPGLIFIVLLAVLVLLWLLL